MGIKMRSAVFDLTGRIHKIKPSGSGDPSHLPGSNALPARPLAADRFASFVYSMLVIAGAVEIMLIFWLNSQ